MNTSKNNKRLAKNTVFLYFRMMLTMLVTLYTSRVILKELGVEDYGIYNVVGGVVAMFSVITSSLSHAISRFITFELGKGNSDRLNIIFSTSVNIQISLSIVILVFVEVIGIWFLNSHMNIPDDRLTAANWVMQCSVVTFVINLISVPYNATIIAHERMQAFAYISVIECFLKLFVAYAITFAFFDKLEFYALMLVVVALTIRVIYGRYCSKHFDEAHWHPVFSKQVFKEIFAFASWNIIGSLSMILQTQGLNIVLNIFFSPIVNAARGVAVQVEGAIQQLASGISTAINPQIIKSYAAGNLHDTNILVCRGAKFIFFILLLSSTPIIFETDFILSLWLVEVPPHAAMFLRILLLGIMVDMAANSLYTAIQATGKIRNFVILNSGIRLLILPVSYLCLYMGAPPEAVFISQISFWYITQIPRIIIVHKLLGLSYQYFFKSVVKPILLVLVMSLLILIPSSYYINNDTWMSSCLIMLISLVVTAIFILTIGLTSSERIFLYNAIRKVIKK